MPAHDPRNVSPNRVVSEPHHHILRIPVGWKYRIKHLFDTTVSNYERHPFQQSGRFRPVGLEFEGWKAQSLGENDIAVAQEREWQVQSLNRLALVRSRLGAQPKHLVYAQSSKFRMAIAESA